MESMRRIITATFLTAAVTLCTNAHDFEAGGIYYNITSDSETAVTYYGDDEYSAVYSGNVAIPPAVTYEGKQYTVTSIGDYAFLECESLDKIEIPESVQTIGIWAFGYCQGLTSIEIPQSVITIEDSAFIGCNSLTSINIPESVQSIGSGVFARCTGLEKFEGKYASEDNRYLSVDGTLIAFAPGGLTAYQIPDEITAIGAAAFEEYGNLTSIDIPNSVTHIGKSAFRGCSSLTSVTIPDGVTVIEANFFTGCGFSSITIPEKVQSIGESAFMNCSNLTSIDVPGSVTSIGYYAFGLCEQLSTITLHDGLTSIEDFAFAESGLTSITIPESVTVVKEFAIAFCRNLASVELPASLTSIGNNAFRNAIKLTSVTVHNPSPANITLGENVFYGVPYSDGTLYVPKGSKELYAAAEQWKEFLDIQEFDSSAISEITMPTNGGLAVRTASGAKGGESIAVYGIDGTLLYSGTASEGATLVSPILGNNGLYLVKVGSHTVKLKP